MKVMINEKENLLKEIEKLKERVYQLDQETYYDTLKSSFSAEEIETFKKEDQAFLENAKTFKTSFNLQQANFFGYPGNLSNDSPIVRKLRELETELFYINNAGDPFERGHNSFDGKVYEKELLNLFFKRYGLDPQTSWGYITSGGSESNLWAIKNAFSKFKKARFYFSKAAHYSIEKALSVNDKQIYPYTIIDIISNKHEAIDMEKLLDLAIYNYQKYEEVPILLLTWGTTQCGSIDDIQSITQALIDFNIPYYCHVDAAFFGGIPANQIDAPVCPTLNELNTDSISISFHKFFGVPQINSVVLSKTKADGKTISYLAHRDTTISGSRSFAIFSANQRIKEVLERSAKDYFKRNVVFVEKALVSKNISYSRDGYSNIFVIPKPSKSILEKYHLASFDGKENKDSCAHFVINPFHTENELKQFILDLADDFKKHPQTLDL